MATYDFWIAALKDPAQIGNKLSVHENDPQPGFYRMRAKDEGADMIPVAIWENAAGEIVAKVGSRMHDFPAEVWTFCCRYPVSEEDCRAAMRGEGWKDTPPETARGMGDNLPDDPFEALVIEVNGEVEIAAELLKKPVKTQDDADKVANFAKRIASLGKKADELFAVEKRPILDAGKAVDNKFRDVRDLTTKVTKDLKRALDAFLAEQRRIEQERQRKAAEEAAIARRKAEEAAAKAANEQSNPDDPEQQAAKIEAERLADEAKKMEKDAQERQVSAGRTGSKVSLRTIKFAVITDFDALLVALKDRDEVKELVQSLANRAAKSDIELPGMKIDSRKEAV